MEGSNVLKIEIFEGADGQHYWHALAANGEIVAHGEAHTSESDAKRAASSVFPGVEIKAIDAAS